MTQILKEKLEKTLNCVWRCDCQAWLLCNKQVFYPLKSPHLWCRVRVCFGLCCRGLECGFNKLFENLFFSFSPSLSVVSFSCSVISCFLIIFCSLCSTTLPVYFICLLLFPNFSSFLLFSLSFLALLALTLFTLYSSMSLFSVSPHPLIPSLSVTTSAYHHFPPSHGFLFFISSISVKSFHLASLFLLFLHPHHYNIDRQND